MPMSVTGSKRPASTPDAGFTLVELMVALAVVAFAAAGLASFWPKSGSRVALQTAAQMLAADLRQARGLAIAHNRTVIVEFNAADARYGNGASQRALPKGVAIAENSAPRIFFRGDGTTAGGEIALQAQARQATVRVARLSGQVMVAE
jgi:prepilin-type N-terminal cleavage/methylation domain-containing protein